MISCRDAKHLFDRYLDGELNPSLQTELHAHRLQCGDCQDQLALLEACGDVIALDHREPMVSASFTDRVLLARRAQLKPVRRSFPRTVLIYGSPLAAAACIALMVSVIRPLPQRTAVASWQEGPPKPVQKALMLTGTREFTKQELRAMEAVPAIPDFEAFLSTVVDKSTKTADDVRRSAEYLLTLMHEGITSRNEKLVAGWRSAPPEIVGDEQVGPPAPGSDQAAPETGSAEPASPMGEPIRNPL